MNGKASWRPALWLSLAVFGASCGGDAENSEERQPDSGTVPAENTVEIYSWWIAGGEAQALALLIDLYKSAYPGRDVLNSTATATATGATEEAFQTMRARLAAGNPPDSWQAILGNNLLEYTRFVPEGADAGVEPVNMTEDLSALYESEGWTDKIPEALLEAMKDGDGIYAVPLSIGRINDLYYNKAIFEKYGLSPPETLADLWAIGEALEGKVDAAGNPIIPMVVAAGYTDSAWPVRFVADAILMAEPNGIQFRQDYYAGNADATDPLYRQAAADFTKLLSQYSNAGNEQLASADSPLHALNLQWEGAADLLHSGRAAMFLHGNWVKAYLESQGDVADTDFGVVQFPPKAFVYAGDSFVISKDARHREAALDFLKLIGSAEVQSAFNKLKGALPARIDADLTGFDSVGRQTAEDLRDPSVSLVPASWDYPPRAYWACWEAAVLQAVRDNDPQAFASACVDEYPLLSEQKGKRP